MLHSVHDEEEAQDPYGNVSISGPDIIIVCAKCDM
jgi:hypothetical protein